MAEKEVPMEWGSESEKGSEQQVNVTKDAPSGTPRNNRNLNPEQMRTILKKYEDEYPYSNVEAFIIKTASHSGNRFYIIKSIDENQMSKFDELFFEMEMLARKDEEDRAKLLFAREGRCKDHKNMTDEEKEDFENFKDLHIKTYQVRIATKAHDKVTNMYGVVYPEEHSKAVMTGNIPTGDISTLSAAIQALSGWSEVSADIDVYEDYLKRDNATEDDDDIEED